jgi:uncharacterized protein YegL
VEVPQPIAIYIMLDKSGSMRGNKWDTAKSSITTFVNDPTSEHIDVALQYFPINGGQCTGAGYDTPAVAMGPLPANAVNITNSLIATNPDGTTPIEGALNGLTIFCNDFQLANPDEQCVGVLITDGEPQACQTLHGPLIGIADAAYNNWFVKTFTVGMSGADFTLLNPMAEVGGTDCTPNPDGSPNPIDGFACDVSAGMTLLAAFEAIREYVTTVETKTEYRTETTTKIAECEWGIPDPPEGEEFDRDMVNVVFSEPGKDDVIIGRVSRKRKCDDVEHGWYYDDPDNPTQIIVCDQTCQHITSVEGGIIDIQFGCETKIIGVE